MVPLWMLPQAIVGGNAFILKPSEQVPLSVVRLAELLQEAGLPDGIFNVLNGGRETVEALCDNEDIQALAFVGSTRVAKIVYGRGAQTGKRASVSWRCEEPSDCGARRRPRADRTECHGLIHGLRRTALHGCIRIGCGWRG